MKEYIKKFETPASANDYAIADIPFITSVVTNPVQNLVCNQSGMKLVNVDGTIEIQTGIPEGFVDFGLPSGTLWYNKNIGATNGNTAESWYGCYYAWGELEEKAGWDGQGTKVPYDWANYKYANGAYNKLTKYCNNSTYGNEGYTDVLTQLVPEDDAATVTNSVWRMPTKEDFEELIAKTTSSWVENYNSISGLNGRIFTKAIITRPAFKNITLYMNGQEVTSESWSQMSIFTLEELNTRFQPYGLDIRDMMFKDAEMTIMAEYNVDYGFVEKESDPSVSMFIPAAGYREGSSINGISSYCHLWSSSLNLDDSTHAYDFNLPKGVSTVVHNVRNRGCVIRPVLTPQQTS